METAVRYRVATTEHVAENVTDNYKFIIYENDTCELDFKRVDFGPRPDIKAILAKGGVQYNNEDFTLEDLQERIDRGNELRRLENQMRAAGVHFASEEQAQQVSAVLHRMMPRVKWWLTEPAS
jgi:hypothetical protein